MEYKVILIIQRCLAWNAFHREYSGIAMAFLRWKFPSIADDHEDIIQRAFTNLISSGLRNFKGTTKYEFLVYFKTIIKNEALRIIEDQNKRRAESLCNEHSGSEDSPPMRELPDPDAGSRPDRIAETREMATALANTLKGYALIDQEVYLLNFRGHMDKEISAILDIPMGTVAVKYARIKSRLRDKFDDHG